jgi:hypothetical protein
MIMDIITENFDNISVNQLYSKLSAKQAELAKVEETAKLESSRSKDYIEESGAVGKNYDKQDFERVLSKFKRRDAEIRSHEQVHASIGPTTSPISYNYQQGPDGKMYAVGGSVRLDTSIPDDPKAAAFKLEQIQKAASGPVDPSGVDSTISQQANLNKMLIELKGGNDAS